jgi:hypothetical protein
VSWASVPTWYGRMNIRSFIAASLPGRVRCDYSGPVSGGTSRVNPGLRKPG